MQTMNVGSGVPVVDATERTANTPGDVGAPPGAEGWQPVAAAIRSLPNLRMRNDGVCAQKVRSGLGASYGLEADGDIGDRPSSACPPVSENAECGPHNVVPCQRENMVLLDAQLSIESTRYKV